MDDALEHRQFRGLKRWSFMLNVAPLVDVTRGDLTECVHLGALAVVDADGRLLHSIGDPYLVTYPRSSAKPLQVMPFIESGGAEHWGFTDRQVAIMCASHCGEDFHVQNVQSILARIGLDKSALMCGVHPPINKDAAARLAAAGQQPTTLHSNCSGKHSGMLSMARFLGVAHDGYYRPDHPVQKRILSLLCEFSDLPAEQITLASDGCTVPTFGLPLYNFALAFARIVQPDRWTPVRQAACKRVVRAMQTNPDMVSGTDRIDTDLLRAAEGSLICKGGAEGYMALAILPSAAFPRGAGIAFKVIDGDATGRARSVATIELLRKLGVLNAPQLSALAKYHTLPVNNMRGVPVGEVHADLSLT
jgi:L-asparaginase II